jgi:hypothetical protein
MLEVSVQETIALFTTLCCKSSLSLRAGKVQDTLVNAFVKNKDVYHLSHPLTC